MYAIPVTDRAPWKCGAMRLRTMTDAQLTDALADAYAGIAMGTHELDAARMHLHFCRLMLEAQRRGWVVSARGR